MDYNLCVPKSARQGPHGLSGDPGFVDPTRVADAAKLWRRSGVFWLREGSPAIGNPGITMPGLSLKRYSLFVWHDGASPDAAAERGDKHHGVVRWVK